MAQKRAYSELSFEIPEKVLFSARAKIHQIALHFVDDMGDNPLVDLLRHSPANATSPAFCSTRLADDLRMLCQPYVMGFG